ncbi:MAG: hypothetical protein KIY11_09380 [Thermoplasmata archaeon]|nr:hypothetical protein [Candidatus Sysuiplasma acidicola]MDH2905581.1 hypothetical protein [Methanomassiliicoccales archaeon]
MYRKELIAIVSIIVVIAMVVWGLVSVGPALQKLNSIGTNTSKFPVPVHQFQLLLYNKTIYGNSTRSGVIHINVPANVSNLTLEYVSSSLQFNYTLDLPPPYYSRLFFIGNLAGMDSSGLDSWPLPPSGTYSMYFNITASSIGRTASAQIVLGVQSG